MNFIPALVIFNSTGVFARLCSCPHVKCTNPIIPSSQGCHTARAVCTCSVASLVNSLHNCTYDCSAVQVQSLLVPLTIPGTKFSTRLQVQLCSEFTAQLHVQLHVQHPC